MHAPALVDSCLSKKVVLRWRQKKNVHESIATMQDDTLNKIIFLFSHKPGNTGGYIYFFTTRDSNRRRPEISNKINIIARKKIKKSSSVQKKKNEKNKYDRRKKKKNVSEKK